MSKLRFLVVILSVFTIGLMFYYILFVQGVKIGDSGFFGQQEESANRSDSNSSLYSASEKLGNYKVVGIDQEKGIIRLGFEAGEVFATKSDIIGIYDGSTKQSPPLSFDDLQVGYSLNVERVKDVGLYFFITRI